MKDKTGKRYRQAIEKLEPGKVLPPKEALALLKELPAAKFDETINVAFNLGIDPKKSDQTVRGTVVLPKGTGKATRVAVIAKGEKQEEARKEGADAVGGDDLLEKIQGGWLGFDILLATPDMMSAVGKLGKLLGQKGLMPSPKSGTVTFEIGKSVKEFKAGKVEYRTDKTGNVHLVMGKRSFTPEQLYQNLMAVYEALLQAKPSSTKGVYLKSLTLSPTMGPALHIDLLAIERERKALQEP